MGADPVRHGADESDDRQVAPGGWRRVLLGLALGALVGAVIGLVLPRDDGPRRPAG